MLEFLGEGLGEPSLHKEGFPNLTILKSNPYTAPISHDTHKRLPPAGLGTGPEISGPIPVTFRKFTRDRFDNEKSTICERLGELANGGRHPFIIAYKSSISAHY